MDELEFTIKVRTTSDTLLDAESVGWYVDDAVRVLAERLDLNYPDEPVKVVLNGITMYDTKERA